jgi:hypothetical protein
MPLKPLPVNVTTVPGAPLAGVKTIVGMTKLAVSVIGEFMVTLAGLFEPV